MLAKSRKYRVSANGPPGRGKAGFTLIEAALATVIVGTGVLAMLAVQQAYHMKNSWAQRTGTAMLLANEIRELTLTMPLYDPIYGRTQLGPAEGQTSATFNDVCDFAGNIVNGQAEGTTLSPPINALRQNINDMAGWSQFVQVESVLSDRIDGAAQPLGTTDLLRVRVSVRYQAAGQDSPTALVDLSWVLTPQQ